MIGGVARAERLGEVVGLRGEVDEHQRLPVPDTACGRAVQLREKNYIK